MQELLNDYSLIVEVPVAWGDMDAFQHVNNTVYFRWFETARLAYFNKFDFDEHMKRDGIGPILAHTQCRFRLPLTYPDTVSVGVGISELGEDRFLMKYIVVSHRHQKLAAEGDSRIVFYDYKGAHKAPLPMEIRRRIIEFEKFDETALPNDIV